MIAGLKGDMKKPLKEIEEKTNKKLEETNKCLFKSQGKKQTDKGNCSRPEN